MHQHDCMKRRLLYAASQAYEPELETMGRTVGWSDRPIVVKREVRGRTIDLALVGPVDDGVVIAFRGSLAPFFSGRHDGWAVLLDWLGDGRALCVEHRGYPGGVHLGFAEATERLWRDMGDLPGVRRAVQHFLDAGAERHLFVTGHSKGGALANLFAWRAASEPEWHDMGVSVATLGAARVGNATFARAYAQSRIVCLRYEVPGDPVPHLPPSPRSPGWALALGRLAFPPLEPLDYHPVGVAISAREEAGGIAARLREFAATIRTGALGLNALTPGLIAAHAICPNSGYDRLICTGEPDRCTHGEPHAKDAGWERAA
jgi:hypothetical protein